MSTTTTLSLIDELYQVPENGKAEIINGKVVRMSPTGSGPSRAAGKIYISLSFHEDQNSDGYAYSDNAGFLVNLPGRQSFSPDAAWYSGPLPDASMDFLPGAPAFAVEVRSKGDYGPQAEREIAKKIADYFAAGTLVVWDVDLLGGDVIKSYRAESPHDPIIFRRGDIADAEPAVPGWILSVDVLFR